VLPGAGGGVGTGVGGAGAGVGGGVGVGGGGVGGGGVGGGGVGGGAQVAFTLGAGGQGLPEFTCHMAEMVSGVCAWSCASRWQWSRPGPMYQPYLP
jgi:hypothetical protein